MTAAVCHQTDEDLKHFFADRAKRTLRYIEYAPFVHASCDRHLAPVSLLRADGAIVLPRFFPRDAILRIGDALDTMIEAGRHLAPVKDRARKVIGAASERLPIRDRVSSIGVEDPLMNLHGIVELAFESRLLELASAYFVTTPMLSYAKVRKSYVNAIPPSPTQHFHVDIGTYSIFKVLLYLNDVAPGGGPFCYVLGSHRQKFADWQGKRHTRDDMIAAYGTDRVWQYHVQAGDAIVVESAGFHGGEKPMTSDRRVLILNYTVHPEYGFEYPPVRMRRTDYNRLAEYARLVADHVHVLDDTASPSK
jgi:CBS domain-containing protein